MGDGVFELLELEPGSAMPKWKSKVSVPNCSCHLKPRPSIRVGKNGQNFEASRASSKAMATGSVEPASSTQASRKFFEAFKINPKDPSDKFWLCKKTCRC